MTHTRSRARSLAFSHLSCIIYLRKKIDKLRQTMTKEVNTQQRPLSVISSSLIRWMRFSVHCVRVCACVCCTRVSLYGCALCMYALLVRHLLHLMVQMKIDVDYEKMRRTFRSLGSSEFPNYLLVHVCEAVIITIRFVFLI